MSISVQREPLVVVDEPKEITVTIKKNGYRIIRSLEDSVLFQRPGIHSSPRKRKILLDNGASKESLIGEHWQARDEGIRGPSSLCSSTYEDELSTRSNQCSRPTNCTSYRLDRPCDPFSNGVVAPHRDDDLDSSLEALFHHPSESSGRASGSHGLISEQNHLCLTVVNGNSLDCPNSQSKESSSLSNVISPERTNSSGNSVLTSRSTSSRTANEPLANSSAWHQLPCQQSIKSCYQNLLLVPDCHRPVEDGQSSLESHSTHSEASNHQVGTCAEAVQTSIKSCCRLPYNGHVEDRKHYRQCQIVLLSTILREEHTSWLRAIDLGPSYVPRLVDFVIGSSCKQKLLGGKCKEGNCPLKHTTQLNFEFPSKYINGAFDIFTKWFLENSHQPDFRAILLILSQLPKDHYNIVMLVLSFSLMILKLANKIHRKALCIKLVEVMVNILELKWWEAVQTLLLFVVTHETQPSEILDLLRNFEISKKYSKNQLYQLVSCLWHLNATFVCPRELIFQVLEDCLVKMPEDLKLTKDRIVADLMTLQLPVLRKAYHLIDKFLSKYYPMNSEIVRVLRSSVLYGNDVSKTSLNDCRAYEPCRVKSTGPVNSKWGHWSIQEARTNAFEMVLKNTTKTGQHQKVNSAFRPMPSILLGAELRDEPSFDNCYNFTGRTSCMTHLMSDDLDIALERVVESLHSEKFEEVAKIISSCGNPYKKNSLDLCIRMIQQELENCNKAEIHRIVIEIFLRLPGSLPDGNSTKRVFACMLSRLVVQFYSDGDCVTALKLIKCMSLVGVSHLEHVPKEIGKSTFITVCCDILFQVRLYQEALITLKHNHCLTLVRHAFDGRVTQEYFVLESIVKNMFRRFLRERHADQAMWIFRIIFSAQKGLHYPFDIAKFYEGVVFLSFIRNLKNPCGIGDGANLYVTVDRVCGNSVRFHSITYRSLLVELHRVNSPEDIIRRTLWICLQRKIYPDFSKGPIHPLVLESHLAKEEISIYFKHYFTYLVGQSDVQRMTRRPFVVRLTESPPPDIKPFPISNDIMKTPRTIPEAMERLKTVLEEIHPGTDADFHQNHVTIPVNGFEKLLGVFEH